MSNFIVSGGLGGPLIVTDGWGAAAPVPTGTALLRFETGDLLLDVRHEGDIAYLIYQDGTNDLKVELPFTEAQRDGNAWAILKLNRVGNDLIITVDKTEMDPIPIVVKPYGGTVHIGEDKAASIFDPRVRNAVISKKASDYYYDDIVENSGNALLPGRG